MTKEEMIRQHEAAMAKGLRDEVKPATADELSAYDERKRGALAERSSTLPTGTCAHAATIRMRMVDREPVECVLCTDCHELGPIGADPKGMGHQAQLLQWTDYAKGRTQSPKDCEHAIPGNAYTPAVPTLIHLVTVGSARIGHVTYCTQCGALEEAS